MTSYVRALPLDPSMVNAGKRAELSFLVSRIESCGDWMMGALLRELFRTGTIARHPSVSAMRGDLARFSLTERYCELIAGACSSSIRSWLSNGNRRVLEIIASRPGMTRDAMSAARHVLGQGYAPRVLGRGLPDETDGGMDAATAYAVVAASRHVFSSRRRPSFGHRSVMLDNHVCSVDLSPQTMSDLVICVSIPGRKRRIAIPVMFTTYARRRLGDGMRARQAVQVKILDDGRILMNLVAEGDMPDVPDGPAVAIDPGAVVPMATSMGDLLCQGMWEKLGHIDALMMRAAKGGTTKSKRYRALSRRARSYVVSEIRRALKRFIEAYRPAAICTEAFGGQFSPPKGTMSRRMCRLLRKAGSGTFRKALMEYSEQYGFEIIEYNPAYTSKGCPRCHCVSDGNRLARDSFHCRECGLKGHADVIAAKHGLLRCSERDGRLWRRHGDRKSVGIVADARGREHELHEAYAMRHGRACAARTNPAMGLAGHVAVGRALASG